MHTSHLLLVSLLALPLFMHLLVPVPAPIDTHPAPSYAHFQLLRGRSAPGLDTHTERSAPVRALAISHSQEHIAACLADNSINVYRVLMYPSLYASTHWPYLYYAKLRLPHRFHTHSITHCAFSANQTYLHVLLDHSILLVLPAARLVDGRTNPPVLNHAQVIFPQDDYQNVWSFDPLPQHLLRPSGPRFLDRNHPQMHQRPHNASRLIHAHHMRLSHYDHLLYMRNQSTWHALDLDQPHHPPRPLAPQHAPNTLQFDRALCPSHRVHSAMLRIESPHSVSVYDSLTERIQLLTPHAPIDLLAASADGRLIATAHASSGAISLYGWTPHNESYTPIQHLRLNRSINALAFHRFRHDFLLLATDAGLLVFRSAAPQVPNCQSVARISSFYLPPAPLDSKLQDRGLFKQPQTYLLVAVTLILLFSIQPVFHAIDTAIAPRLATPTRYADHIASLLTAGLLAFSIFEALAQPAFVNDWPAHLHHIRHFDHEQTRNYAAFMHYHGPNTYPAGFVWLYLFLVRLTSGSLLAFQLFWALLEAALLQLTYRLTRDHLRIPPLLALLPFLSNRLHLYNVRVVINDMPSVLLMYLVIALLLRRRWTAASVLYSFVLSTKLNFVFYGPAMLYLYLSHLGLTSTIMQGVYMLATQLIVGYPFLRANAHAYIATAFDLSRTLLWEKTRNFKFVGRHIYDSPLFHRATLITILILLALFFLRLRAHHTRAHTLSHHQRLFAVSLFATNHIFVTLARGLYTPFMCWYFYAFPALLYTSGTPVSLSALLWLTHEYLFRGGPLRWELLATAVYYATNVLVLANLLHPDPARTLFRGLPPVSTDDKQE